MEDDRKRLELDLCRAAPIFFDTLCSLKIQSTVEPAHSKFGALCSDPS